jgi:prophage tail gpP-like protein
VSDHLTAKINGMVFDNIVTAKVGRDLEQLAGTFEMTIVDQARLSHSLLAQIGQPRPNGPINPGDAITILIDDEPVLVGTIEQPHFAWEAGDITCHIHGRDMTGDLVECAPPPELPTEFRNVDLLHVASQVCAKFKIPVTADVSVGAPFDRLTRHKHMTAIAFLESGSRQRSILLTSNGIGGLVLTRGGTGRAPEALSIGDNVWRVETEYDWTKRFSDYYVMQDKMPKASSAPGMLISDVPDDSEPDDEPDAVAPTPATATGTMGHATDPEITRYRPTVRLTRSQSGMSSLQEQAEWMCRVAKGLSIPVRLTVLGFRAGPKQALWRPNQLAGVWEPYSGLDRDMLIAGVEFEKTSAGDMTHLRMVGPSAYDRINEADRKRRRKAGPKTKASGNLISTVPGT